MAGDILDKGLTCFINHTADTGVGRNMPEFPLAVMDRLIRKVGKVRVSRGAALELSAVLEAYATDLAKEAIKLAEHRGAKTVTDIDIRAAASRIRA